MAGTVGNIIVGMQGVDTAKVGVYGTAEGACDELGFLEGGIEISNAREYFEKKADQNINTLGVVKTSERMTVKFSVAEATLANLAKANDYPAGAIAGGTVLTMSGAQAAIELTLFINCNSVGGNTRKYEFPRVICLSPGTHSYKLDDKTMIEFEFLVMYDAAGICIVTDSGVDVTAPTIALDGTTVDNGGVVSGARTPIQWLASEALDPASIAYGDEDNATFMVLSINDPDLVVVIAGVLTYDAALLKLTFIPTDNWAAHVFQSVVTTGLKDLAGNHLAALKIENFTGAP